MFDNLCYCFSCGYDADHKGWQYPCAKAWHQPNVMRKNAHEYEGASMKAQHKMPADSTGAGMAWILAQGVTKAQYVMTGLNQYVAAQRTNTNNPYGGRICGGGRDRISYGGRGYGGHKNGGGRNNYQKQWQGGYGYGCGM